MVSVAKERGKNLFYRPGRKCYTHPALLDLEFAANKDNGRNQSIATGRTAKLFSFWVNRCKKGAVFPHNFYLAWRAGRFGLAGFAEKADQAPPEALLQQVWLYQRIVGERLQTTDGRAVKVLHPGFWNREAGPDFRKAIVQIGNEAPVTGDVEIDLIAAGWEQHAHATNPSYRNVVLHVTWEPGTHRHNLPSVSLKHALDSTVPELTFWLGIEPKPMAESLAGLCSAPLRNLEPSVLKEVLRQAAQARLQRKAEQLQGRARQVGWEGALWEGLFAALGYKKNTWAMRRLGELAPGLKADKTRNLMILQARLLGVSGLLPSDFQKAKPSEAYLRAIWDIWWREADQFRELVLPENIWTMGGLRPANHPQRRLALAAHWIATGNLVERIEDWLNRTVESPDFFKSIESILQVKEDPFWSYRWTLRGKPFKETQPLLGEQRITDLVMNVILPWLYLRALAGKNEKLAQVAESRYFLWPAGEDNSVLKLARARLFGGVSARFFKTAAEQQAILQIVRDFCDHSNAACENCPFPELVTALSPKGR